MVLQPAAAAAVVAAALRGRSACRVALKKNLLSPHHPGHPRFKRFVSF